MTFIALLAVFAILTVRPRRVRDLLPGVALATVGAVLLQTAGAWYVNRTIKGATATYGTFALVIGLLSWFVLAANLLLIAAEVNVVLRWKAWPRSLTGELAPADRAMIERSASSERKNEREQVVVNFGEPPED